MGQIVRIAVAMPLLGASLALGSAGAASATPSVVGMTYDKAQEAVSKSGTSAEVSTSIGTELQQGDCIVVNQVVRPATKSGRQYVPARVLLSLNCNAVVATAGDAGNSAASPAGQAAKKEQAAEAWRATPDGQAWCVEAQSKHPDWFPLIGCPTE